MIVHARRPGDYRRGVASVLICFLLLAPSVLTASASEPTTTGPPGQHVIDMVGGDVINGTPGGTIPADLVVTLHVFSGTEERGVFTTTLESDSSFRFSEHVEQKGNAALEEGQVLVARVVYDGVTYLSDFARVEQDPADLSLPITIYEATGSADEIVVAQLHVFLTGLDDRVQIAQYGVIANNGLRTYTGTPHPALGRRATWSVRLPDQAANLRIITDNGDGRLVALDDGIADTRPVPPGVMGAEASFVYELPYHDGVQVAQVFDISVDAVVLVAPEGQLHLEGAGISSGEMLQTETGPAVSYTAGPLAAGEPLSFRVMSGETAGGTQGPADDSRRLAAGVAILAASAAAAYWLWRPPTPGPMPERARPGVEAIVALDEEFERGRIAEGAYRERRRALKKQLRAQLADDRQ